MAKITRITSQRKNPERKNIYLDGRFAFSLDALEIAQAGLKIGENLNPQEIVYWQKLSEDGKAYAKALRILSLRLHSSFELRRKLKNKFPPPVVARVAKRLREEGYLNDSKFAQIFIEERLALHPRAMKLIKQELRTRGVVEEIIKKASQNLFDEEKEIENALKLAQKKARSIRAADWQDFFKKVGGYLVRKGYSYSIIRQVITKENFPRPSEEAPQQ